MRTAWCGAQRSSCGTMCSRSRSAPMAEPAQLRAVAERLRSLLDNAVSPDARAYASLMKAGERQPWTEAARRIWVAAGSKSEWLHHHLAVVHHSAAYDLEVKG